MATFDDKIHGLEVQNNQLLVANGIGDMLSRHGWQFREGLPTTPEINGRGRAARELATSRIGVQAEVRFPSHPLGGNGGPSRSWACLRSLPFRPCFRIGYDNAGRRLIFLSSWNQRLIRDDHH
jgi:hypothetical protein